MIALIGFLLYQRGYNEAVESARLVYADDTSYLIAYNGAIHQYDYE